jgi:hypothetical protein
MHAHIEQHHVWRELAAQALSRLTVSGLAHHAKIGRRLQQRAQLVSH